MISFAFSLHRSDQRTESGASASSSTSTGSSSSTQTPNGHASVGGQPDRVNPLPDEKHEEALPRYKRDLVAKMKILRTELQTMQPQSGHCRLEVSRTEIFEVCSRLESMFSVVFKSLLNTCFSLILHMF